jgi:hypothetical protein
MLQLALDSKVEHLELALQYGHVNLKSQSNEGCPIALKFCYVCRSAEKQLRKMTAGQSRVIGFTAAQAAQAAQKRDAIDSCG